jgi:fused signal recognition particle receptor
MLGWFKKKKIAGADTAPQSAVMPLEEKLLEENTAAEGSSENAPDRRDAMSEGAAPGEETRKQENRQGLFERLQERLAKTRESFVSRVDDLFLGKKEIDAQLKFATGCHAKNSGTPRP